MYNKNNNFDGSLNYHNTYLLFLKLEKDINDNKYVPFYFKPRQREESSMNFRSRARKTLKTEIKRILNEYREDFEVIYQFNNNEFEILNPSIICKIRYNSFQIILFKYGNDIIVLNYFNHDYQYQNEQGYFSFENLCIPSIDQELIQEHSIQIETNIRIINTYEPFMKFSQLNGNGEKFDGKNNPIFWNDVRSFMNNQTSTGKYNFYRIGNVIVLYDYQQDVGNQINLFSKDDFNDPFEQDNSYIDNSTKYENIDEIIKPFDEGWDEDTGWF